MTTDLMADVGTGTIERAYALWTAQAALANAALELEARADKTWDEMHALLAGAGTDVDDVLSGWQ